MPTVELPDDDTETETETAEPISPDDDEHRYDTAAALGAYLLLVA
ncbi:hypothetical protein ACIQNU_43355 [Streptomyces sp. NPDC091292]